MPTQPLPVANQLQDLHQELPQSLSLHFPAQVDFVTEATKIGAK